MRRIEFSGIPGSGKSTIVPVVARYLKRNGRDVVDRNNLIHRSNYFPFNSRYFQFLMKVFPPKQRERCNWCLNNFFHVNYEYQLQFMADHLPLLQYLVGFVNARPIPEDHKRMLVRWFVKMAGCYQMARECLGDDDVFLFDEGYVQKVVSLYISVEEETPAPAEIERYLDQIPGGLTLINVQADQEKCKRRILDRNLPKRLKGREQHEIETYLSRSRVAIDFAASYMARKGGQVVVIDNSKEPFVESRIQEQLSGALHEERTR